MKRTILSLVFFAIWLAGFSGNWIEINSSNPSPTKINLVSSTIERSKIHFTLDGFSLNEVQTPKGTAYTVSIGKATPMLIEGAPDLPKLTSSVIIPDLAGMSLVVVSSSYKDYENLEIAPSKGTLMRDVDPSKVPFQYGKIYNTNKFFPGNLTDTREPFIVRELRGQTLLVYPFQYNPVTKTLRVYYDLTVELFKSSESGVNPLIRKTQGITLDHSFSPVYSHEFLNFDAVSYTPLAEYGKMLVICYGSFMEAMQPYVNWKNEIGIPTEMINVTTAGATSAAIKSYIANYYNTNSLTFVL